MYQYIVKPGDTLETIADHYGMSVEFIIAANPELQNQPIYAGQRILIPISRYLDQIQFPRYYWGN